MPQNSTGSPIADQLRDDFEDAISLKGLRDKASGAVSSAKNWLTGSKPAAPAQDDWHTGMVKAANDSIRDSASTPPPPAKTKPGQRIMAGKKVQPK